MVCVGLCCWNRGSCLAAVKAPAEAKALLFIFFASKIITYLRSMELFGAALILVLEISL